MAHIQTSEYGSAVTVVCKNDLDKLAAEYLGFDLNGTRDRDAAEAMVNKINLLVGFTEFLKTYKPKRRTG